MEVDLGVPPEFEEQGEVLLDGPILLALKSNLGHQEEILIWKDTANDGFFDPHFIARSFVGEDWEFLALVVDQKHFEVVLIVWIVLKVIAPSATEFKLEEVGASFESEFFLDVGFAGRSLIEGGTRMQFYGHINVLNRIQLRI